MEWRLRPSQPQDEAFLRRVYAATRAAEIALAGWSAQQAEAFLRMQFDAQHQQYHARHPDAAFDIIVADGQDAGRLYVRREAGRVHVIDIAILPPWRGQGLGGALLQALQAEAREAGACLSIYVEINNRAQGLYQRLGFQEVSNAGLYRLMEWRAATA